MSAQHTPAPWWTTDHGVRDSGGYIFHTNSVQRYEGQDERYAREVAMREADKLLGAAAPELLEALKGLEEAYCRAGPHLTVDERFQDRKRLIAARAAIAKTTGSAT